MEHVGSELGALHTMSPKPRGRCPNSFREMKEEVH